MRAKTAHGEDYDNRYCGIFVVRDGRIHEVREYFDSASAARVLYPGRPWTLAPLDTSAVCSRKCRG